MNKINAIGSTALYLAAHRGHSACLELLIKAGANVNIRPTDRMTPLIAATYAESEICLQMLIKAGADMNITNKDGETALIVAAKLGNEKLVELLIKEGANVNTVGKHGSTALMNAANNGNVKVVKMLIECSLAGVNVVNRLETSASNLSMSHTYNPCFDLLLQAGANLNSKGGTFWLNCSITKM